MSNSTWVVDDHISLSFGMCAADADQLSKAFALAVPADEAIQNCRNSLAVELKTDRAEPRVAASFLVPSTSGPIG